MTFIPLDTLVAPAGPRPTTSLHYRRNPLAHPETQLATLDALSLTGGPTRSGNFEADLEASGWPNLTPSRLEIFQINVGKLCNMTCKHCHVDSGPDRTEENMVRETVDACLDLMARSGAHTLDLTGGAPELNPHFRYLVEEAKRRGMHVMDRCNLTILTVPRFKDLAAFLADYEVEVVCSLPHYRKLGTDAQRGDGTFEKSLKALKMLNDVGYGHGDGRRVLSLVTNPVGAFLAGNQSSLEQEWKDALLRNHGLRFDRLLALNNMPISRYLEWLEEKGQTQAYMERLLGAFNPATIAGLMCRNTLSVGWDGKVYDCDFNQQLELPILHPDGTPMTVFSFDLNHWNTHTIRTERHCYGCTAGCGSGCGGAISN